AIGAHRDAVADSDRVESHADHSGGLHAFFHFLGKMKQMHVAGVAFEPHAGDSNLRLLKIGVRKAGGIQHCLPCALRFWSCDTRAVLIQLSGHPMMICGPWGNWRREPFARRSIITNPAATTPLP